MTVQRKSKRAAQRRSSRKLHHQTLERRELLAAELGGIDAPRLVALAANAGENFNLNATNTLSVAPDELTFRFGGGQEIDPATLAGIRFIPSGGDGSFDADDLPITPGFLGFADDGNSRIVVARFAETLADDAYKIEIAGFDDTNLGIRGLRNTDGHLFQPTNPLDPLRPVQEIRFNVEVGPRVLAVVPQPIEGVGSGRIQRRDQIHVFFNQDPLSNPAAGPITSSSSSLSVVNPNFYKLIYTSDSVENTDDTTYLPLSVTYDPLLNRAVLTYPNDLSELSRAAANNGAGTYRLRVGSGDALPTPPTILSRPSDPGDLYSNAIPLGAGFGLGTSSFVVTDTAIRSAQDVIPQWPGAGDAVGSREDRRDSELVNRIDTTTGINVYEYNFASLYGVDAQLTQLNNAITEAQKQRVREVLALYSERLGVQFVETANRGLQFVTGDLRAISQSADTGSGVPYSLYRVSEQDPTRGVLILDGGENWFDLYGLSPDPAQPSYFVEAVRGVGNLLGIGHLFHLPPGVGAGGSSPDEPNSVGFSNFFPSLPLEPSFLSQSDVTLGQALHRPESSDIDFYSFTATTNGRLTTQTFAERLDGGSLLDTNLRLYRVIDAAAGRYELIANNDDYFSDDSFVTLDITAGNYIIGVSAAGNDRYDGNVPGSGIGGVTEGRYELRVTFEGEGESTITDTSGSRLDGDADGNQGGEFNFWFRTARDVATPAAGVPRVIFVDKLGLDTNNGTLAQPLRTVSAAFAASRPGDIVRLLPNGGADGLIQTTGDNVTYEFGRGGTGNAVLRDGVEFKVPRGVAVMIDAGAILKFRGAKISVGSESIDEDRSLASLQVLGTPLPVMANGSPRLQNAGSVYFTSYDDQSIGVDTNPLPTVPQAGNWAGIDLRNDIDFSEGRSVRENEGIFLDYISHANMRFGGGSISATQPIVTPIQMTQSRPTLIYNTITDSADAAISADPNSFLESNFHAPIYQRVARFTSDYDRVGPEISGNRLTGNSINGLFIRVLTPAAGQLEPMTVSGRFDDTDIVHSLSQVLVLQGQPGGPILLEQRPDVLNVTLADATGGTLVAGQAYDYKITYVTTQGSESLASLSTVMRVASAGGAIRLQNLPVAPAEFAGRRLYRLNPATGDYEFVQSLDRRSTTFVDTGRTRGGLLPDNGTSASTLLPRYDARLTIDPGIVVKLQSARIEATFGADFYAEGTDGREVIFTSRLDDSYGAGGTFDTNNDGISDNVVPGGWGGLVFRQDSTASLDYVHIAYGGGSSPIEGTLTDFNAVEIHQAKVRIAHSTLQDNLDGFTTAGIRGGRGFNGPATIFVRGAQPVIVENTIVDNAGAAISINPNALDFHDVLDHGRSTGVIDVVGTDMDNQGPLISGNRLSNNAVNGLLVRSEILTTESVWDDTDIVHVVTGDIVSMTHHYRSGLRLKSDPNQSLVVKLDNNASLVGSGRPLDIVDRVGGTLQVIGQGGFPVILTSLHDDSVGAGFTPAGIAQTNTDNGDTTPQPGDWRGLQLLSYVNDRNVAFVPERERSIAAEIADNATVNRAQVIGLLARNEYAGDENARLGFNIRGALTTPLDQDVYRFEANGGTQVYIDIDDTTFGLDTVVELIDVNSNVLAASDNSFAETTNPGLLVNNLGTANVQSLIRTGIGVVESPNSLDAGMRVVLPGSDATVNTYFVRVRTAAARSQGQYQLSIRLREADEIAGSTIQLADIRYATDAISVSGAPLHSPLAGDNGEILQYTAGGVAFDPDASTLSFTPAQSQRVGNLMTSDRGSLVITGEIGNASPTIVGETRLNDLDVYQVDVFKQQLESDVFDSENRFVPVTFDIDYADGLGRVNTSIAVYNAAGRLILHSRDSNVSDDQGRPTQGVDTANLTGGSASTKDAYIGPVELPEGTYYVVVSSAAAIPEALGQFFQAAPVNNFTRLAPINSVRRLVNANYDDPAFLGYTADGPVVPPEVTFTSRVEYSLDDIRLFVSFESGIGGGQEVSSIASINPFTGTLERLIGEWLQGHGDIAMRDDGTIYTYTTDPPPNTNSVNGNIGNYLRISSVDGAATPSGDDGLIYQRTNDQGTGTENDAIQNGPEAVALFEAIAFPLNDVGYNNRDTDGGVNNTTAVLEGERFFGVANRSFALDPRIPAEFQSNILYQLRTQDGLATNRGSTQGELNRTYPAQVPYVTQFGPTGNRFEHGIIDTGNILGNGDGGLITGMAYIPGADNQFYGVTDNGGVHRFSSVANASYLGYNGIITTTYYGQVNHDPLHAQLTGNAVTDPVSFTGMTLGPRNIQNRAFRDVMFATTADSWLYAFKIEGGQLVPANVFVDGRSAVPIATATGTLSPTPAGLAFSTLESAPWHTTGDRRNDQGHSELIPYDQSRLQQQLPNNSVYYGFEITNEETENTYERPDGDPLGQLAPGGSQGSIISQPFSLEGYAAGDKPTVYFSYIIDVEVDDDYVPGQRRQNDSLRVFASGDNGQWQLLATNNTFRELGSTDEYDYFNQNEIPVQTLFDEPGAWRQARIDISPLAGNENVRLRFDFSTAGAMRSNFGSIELVGVPGDEVPDRSTFQVGGVTFENLVGQDLIVPAGARLTTGDQFTVTGPNGVTTMTFVEGPVANPTPGQIVYLATDSAAEVAAKTVAALPKSLRPYADGGGRISLLAASDFQALGDTPVSSESLIPIDDSFDQLVIPDGDRLFAGERIILTGGGTTTVLTYVDAATATGASGEILFDPADSSAAIAARILPLIPVDLGAYWAGTNLINFSRNVAIGYAASSTNITTNVVTVSESRIEVTVPVDLAGVVNNSRLNFERPDGTIFTLEFINTDVPPGPNFVATNNANRVQLAQRIYDALPQDLRPVLNGPSVTVISPAVTITNGASTFAISNVNQTGSLLSLSLPPATLIRSGEQIRLGVDTDGAGGPDLFRTITFVETGRTTNVVNNVVFFTDGQPLSELYADVLDLLQPGFGAYLNVVGDAINFAYPTTLLNVVDPVETTDRAVDVNQLVVPISVPDGSLITPGETLTITPRSGPAGTPATVLTFRLDTGVAAGPNEVLYLATDTALEIAAKLVAAIPAALQATLQADGNIYLFNASEARTSPGSSIIGFGFQNANVVGVAIDSTMTSSQVAQQIRISLAQGLGRLAALDGISRATVDQYPINGGDRIRIYTTSATPGPYGLNQPLLAMPGDEFGESVSTSFTAPAQIRVNGASENNFGGVHIDDIVVGFAERGEMVLDAPLNNFNFLLNPETLPDTHSQAVQPERQNEILTGAYSLEVRTSDEFGVPQDYDPVNLLLGETVGLGRSFDTNDRLSTGAVTLVVPAGQDLVDGDTFVLYDGVRSLTFEFDDRLRPGVVTGRVAVPFDASEDEPQFVAAALRNAINSPQARSVLNVFAATIDGTDANTTPGEKVNNGNRVELFGPAIQINPGGGRFIKMDLVKEETFQGRDTSRRIPVIDHLNQTVDYVIYGDQLANAAVSGYVDGTRDVLVGVGKIGDQVNVGLASGDDEAVLPGVPAADFDFVKIYLAAGVSVDIDVDTAGFAKGRVQLDARLGVFDNDGNLLAQDVGGSASGETLAGAFLTFTAPASGYYILAVGSGDFISFGEYTLTVRPTVAVNPAVPSRDVLMVDYQFGVGDVNRVKDQGQIIIASNFISNSSGFGIAATAGPRGQGVTNGAGPDAAPRPGTARLLRNINATGIVPGAVISNNVIYDSGSGGILFSGGTRADGQSQAPVPYGRIVNNTVVGNGSGSGITVSSSASPTLLNNIVTNFSTGLNIDGSSIAVGAVADGNAFQGNGTNSTIPLTSSSTVIPVGTPLFADATRDLYIPAAGSFVIDSSFASLPDRGAFFNSVKQPAGIAPSPIVAPSFDAYGQPRVDDPTVTTPGGVGSNVFIDRGAIDRADQTRPVSVLTSPQDAIGAVVLGGDIDGDESFVRLASGTVEFFEIQLLDPSGTGPDMDTINDQSVLLTENGRRLISGVDFVFGYSDNSRTIRLTPLAGLWRPDAVYEITLNNQQRIAYEAPAGDSISDGDRLTLTDSTGAQSVFEFESGFTASVPQTFTLSVLETNAGFVDRDTLTITAPDGNSLTFEINLVGSTAGGNIPINLVGAGTVQQVRQRILAALEGNVLGGGGQTIRNFLNIDPVLVGNNQIQLGTIAGHSVTGTVAGLSLSGVAGGVADGDVISYTSGGVTGTFEFDTDGDVMSGRTAIPLARTDTPTQIAQSIAAVLRQSSLGLGGAQSIGDGALLIGGRVGDVLALNESSLQLTGSPGVTGSLTMTVDALSSGVSLEGTTFQIRVGNSPVTFRYTTDPSLTSADRLILLAAGDNPGAIATKTRAQIAAAFPDDLSPTVVGAVITLGEQPALPPAGQSPVLTTVNGGTAGLLVGGVSGGAISVNFLPSTQFTPASVAATLQAAIGRSPLQVGTFAPGGGTLLISGARSLTRTSVDGSGGNAGTLIPAVSDLAGNAVRETRINNETRFTIIMPDVVFDLGDAPASYGTLLSDNGARHTIGGVGSPILGTAIDSEADGKPSPDSDDLPIAIDALQVGGKFDIVGASGQLQVTVNDNAVAPGTRFILEIGGVTTVYELVDAASNPATGNIAVNFAVSDSPAVIASNLIAAIRPRIAASGGGLRLSGVGGNAASFTITSVDDEDGVSVGVFTSGGINYNVFTIPGTDPNNVTGSGVLGYLNPLDPAGTNLAVTVTGSGLLDAWIDFNANGVFDSGEQVLTNQPVVDGVNILSILVPADAPAGDTWARFRISDGGNLTPTGVAVGGEVEDYRVSVLPRALPTPNDDVYTTVEDTPLSVATGGAQGGIFDNDNDITTQLLPVRFFVGTPPANGTLEIIDQFTGEFIYRPNDDFNGTDSFTYRLSTQQNTSPDALAASTFATVTINVTAVNDPPTFQGPRDLEFLEVELGSPESIAFANFVTNVVPGPPTATDEAATQTVTFQIVPVGSSNPTNLMTQPPRLQPDGTLLVFPRPDEFGTATYLVRGSDDDPNDPRSTDVTFTITIRPVNDAPRFNPNVAGTADAFDADDSYSVANVIGPNGLISDASITYTLREDNTQPTGDPANPVTTGTFFIPLRTASSGTGYDRLGILDVFNPGPLNETSALPGGSQVLELINVPTRTVLGGTLTPVMQGGQMIGLNYTPPLNFNSSIGSTDSFTYTVGDDSPVGGETYSLDAAGLVEDRLTATNTVRLNMNPVNDRPQFSTQPLTIDVSEDSPRTFIDRYAFDIAAAPPNSAFDEVDVNNGQRVTFTVAALNFANDQASRFFSEFPSITPDGDLSFRPAADVFGTFTFQVTLNDNGPDNSTRGDLISSLPVTMTINILPVNDPPVVNPALPQLSYQVVEDNSIDIPVAGDGSIPGLLGQFLPGPANEASDITPGGNQTVRLADPVPISTAQGGTLTATRDSNGNVTRLRYTPRPNFTGQDSFIYTVIDNGTTVLLGSGGSATSDPRIASTTVLLNVSPVNDAPQFGGAFNVDVDEDAGTVVLPNWATNVQAGPNGANDEINGQNGTPAQQLTFIITQVSTTNPALFAIPPTATASNGNGVLTFRAADNASGSATFTVQLRDNGSSDAAGGNVNLSEIRTFTINVAAVNDPPTFTGPTPVIVNEDSGGYNATWATNISPGEAGESSQTVRFEVITPAASQSLFATLPRISPAGVLQFTPADNANGFADVIVRAIDSDNAVSPDFILRIQITPINDAPVAVPDTLDTDEDAVLAFTAATLLSNDLDVDRANNPDETLSVSLPAESFTNLGARLVFDAATGAITYDPTNSLTLQRLRPGQSLTDTFSYRARDVSGAVSLPVTVSVNVAGRNDAPRLVADIPSLNPDGTTIIRPLVNDSDIDGSIDPASIQIVSQPAFGSVQTRSDGSIVYIPFANFTGSDTFSYTVADDLGLRSAAAIVTVGNNIAPDAVNDFASTFFNEGVTINVVQNDTDNDNLLDLGSLQIANAPANGTADVNPDGTIRYVPSNNFVGTDTFTYTIADESGRVSAPATVSVRVLSSRLQNPNQFRDVNNDGFITAIDALLIINRLNRAGNVASVPVLPSDVAPPYYDVSGDRQITAQDALLVINALSRPRLPSGEGEFGSTATATPLPTTTSPLPTAAVGQLAGESASPATATVSRVVATTPVPKDSEDWIDLIAKDRAQTPPEDESAPFAAVDAALAKLL